MTYITLDFQIVEKICPHCHQNFSLCRGSVYNEEKPFAIHLAALHCCQPGALVNVAICIVEGYDTLKENTSIAMKVIPAETEFQVRIVELQDSPWESENYLGYFMGKEEARQSDKRNLFPYLRSYCYRNSRNQELSGIIIL